MGEADEDTSRDAELQRLIAETHDEPDSLAVDMGNPAARREHLKRWANAVVEVYEHARETGSSADEIEANHDIAFETYQQALAVLETGKLPTTGGVHPLDEES